jgi:endonuclease III related protein
LPRSPQRERERRKREEVKVRKTKSRQYYRALSLAWGAQHWWPAETAFEVIVGSVPDAEHSLDQRGKGVGEFARCAIAERGRNQASAAPTRAPDSPFGLFPPKGQAAEDVRSFLDKMHTAARWIELFAQPTDKLREELLELNGVGPETADSILLYAGNHPVFVVDAYTRRILGRHGIVPEKTEYEEMRELFEKALAPTAGEPQEPAS